MEMIKKCDNNPTVTERLFAAERVRLQGVKGYTIDEFEQNMRSAIARGANHKTPK